MQIDGSLVPYGRRLKDLDISEFLSYVYTWFVDRIHDPKARAKFDRSLQPDDMVVSGGGLWLPPELQGERPPDWWTG